MKSRSFLFAAAIALVVAVTIPPSLISQQTTRQKHRGEHHHYKLIEIGTFGGPSSYNESFPPENIINSRGAAAAYADTSVSDPYAPNCFNPDCFVSHASMWERGSLIDLGSLPGGYSSFASSINARGEIVGASQNGQIDPLTAYPETTAVLWNNGIMNLGTLGGNQSVANAISDRGDVAGAALNAIPDQLANAFSLLFLFVPAATQAHAFRWTEAHGMQDLGTLGGPDSAAAFVNQRGQIAGQSYTNATINPTTGYATLDPFFWENGTMIDIGTLGGTFGYPNWMNNRGQVVGQSNLSGDSETHAFRWDKKSGLKDLGTLGGSLSGANWINDAGEAVGIAGINSNTFHGSLWKDGRVIDLGSLNHDPCSPANSINSHHQIVGGTSPDCLVDGRAYLWENGGPMVDLNTLATPGSGLTVVVAVFINDRGEIAAKGKFPNNDERAVVLIPCDENHPGVEGCDYSLVDAAELPQVPAPLGASSGTSDRARPGPRETVPFRNHFSGSRTVKSGIAHGATAQPFWSVAGDGKTDYLPERDVLVTPSLRGFCQASGNRTTGYCIAPYARVCASAKTCGAGLRVKQPGAVECLGNRVAVDLARRCQVF
jgi:probable HAF family extracellular repeat protein